MHAVYLLDASSWIKVQAMDVPEAQRDRLWLAIGGLVEEDRIRTVEVVLDEVHRNSPDTYDRMAPFIGSPGFRIRKRDQLADHEELEILRQIGQRFRSLRRNQKGRDKGDAYLVARALVAGHVVVTEEGGGRGKIPAVCDEMGVACRALLELVVAEGLV